MREIKFRAWDKHNEKWVYETIESICSAIYFNDISVLDLPSSDCGDSIPKIFCQFTGLKDKNDKEIYEGDIVAGYAIAKGGAFIDDVVGEIKYSGLCFVAIGIQAKTKKQWFYTITNPDIKQDKNIEVIGNIYENPELLEKK